MTRLALLIAVLLPVALAQGAPGGADPVERYHAGARAYIDGDVERARAAVAAGLAAAPGDARLQALRDLIEQEQDEQDQREGGQQDQEGENESEPGDGDESPSGSGGEPPPADEPEAEADQTRTPPRDNGQDADEPQDGRRPGQGEATPEGPAPAPEGQMSRAQAERILDAVGGEEQLLLRELQRAPTRGRRADKDW